MIHPSYVDLMKVVNKGVEEGEEPVISSRYSVVMATARRARQLIAGDDPMVGAGKGHVKPLSIAVEELNDGDVRILNEEEKEAERARIAAELAEAERLAAEKKAAIDAEKNASKEDEDDGE